MTDALMDRIKAHRSAPDVYDPPTFDQMTDYIQELTLQLLATSGQAADALDKLAKAVEGLRKIANYTHIGEYGQSVTQHAEARIARAVLAELEGGQ